MLNSRESPALSSVEIGQHNPIEDIYQIRTMPMEGMMSLVEFTNLQLLYVDISCSGMDGRC